MQVLAKATEVYAAVKQAQDQGKIVGVVPTMGALHDGHLSLVQAARDKCDFVVATIFVNPTQFAPEEDLEKYPRPIEKDLAALKDLQTDVAFCPPPDEVYPKGFSTFVDPPDIAAPFEGKSRETHFRGVATVVLKLFHMVPADISFFGQKDFQQTLVVKNMVNDLNIPMNVVVCPIVREPDGLAMSSRNVYLSPDERTRATCLYRGLQLIESEIGNGREIKAAEKMGRDLIEGSVDQLEYLKVVNVDNLEEASDKDACLVVLVAARVGSTRLIDNLLIDNSRQNGKTTVKSAKSDHS